MSSLLTKIFSSKGDSDKRKEERIARKEKRASKRRETGLATTGTILGGGIGATIGDIVGHNTTHRTISDIKDRQWRSKLNAFDNSSSYDIYNSMGSSADPHVRNRAFNALNKEISSANKLTKATEDAVKATRKYQRGSLLRGGLVGAGLGLAAGVGGAAIINHNIKKKKKQKTFSDRSSAWWRERIKNLEEKDPNSPRLKTWREQLDIALRDEALAEGASEEAKAAGRAAEERLKNNSSAGQSRASRQGYKRSSSSSSSGGNPWEEFTKAWNKKTSEFREKMRAADNAKMDEIFNKATENAKKNEANFAEAKKWTDRLNKKNKKANKVAVGIGLASLGTVAGIKAYQHYKDKKKKED